MPYFQDAGFDTYALDLRGHGNTPCDTSLNLVSTSDYLADIQQAVAKIGQTPVLVGHSMGGYLVQKYLEKSPSKATILLAPTPLSGVWGASLGYLMRFPGYFFLGSLTLDMYQLIGRPRQTKWAFFSNEMSSELVEGFQQKMQNESFRVYLEMFFPRVKFNFHTQSPMLLLAGENDNIFSPKSEEKTAKRYGAEYKLFPEMAHDMMLDLRWKEVADTMIEWLKDVA